MIFATRLEFLSGASFIKRLKAKAVIDLKAISIYEEIFKNMRTSNMFWYADESNEAKCNSKFIEFIHWAKRSGL